MQDKIFLDIGNIIKLKRILKLCVKKKKKERKKEKARLRKTKMTCFLSL
jgi:hypothetical protein